MPTNPEPAEVKDYCCRLLASPEEGNEQLGKIEQAWLLVYARASSPEEAAAMMLERLRQDHWEVMQTEGAGVIDLQRTPDPGPIERSLALEGTHLRRYSDTRRTDAEL